jgi:hypothetical protein
MVLLNVTILLTIQFLASEGFFMAWPLLPEPRGVEKG